MQMFKSIPTALLRARFKGAVYERGDEGFDSRAYQYATTSYNGAGMKPAFIVYAQNDADVINAIQLAQTYKLAIAVRTGGHHYCGASSTSGKNIQLDLSKTYTTVEWEDPAVNDYTVVTFGVGTSLGSLNSTLKDHRRFVPTGQCSYVNVGGHAQTGGYGTSARGFGLFADHIQKLRIVTADKEQPEFRWIHRHSESEEEKELFYSVLGGSPGNFGVISHVTLKVHKDEDHPLSRGFRGQVPYNRHVLKNLLDLVLTMGDAEDFPADYDMCITMLSERPAQYADSPEDAKIIIFAQWANLEGAGQVYDPAFFNKLMAILGGPGSMNPHGRALLEDDAMPMSTLCNQWVFPIVREFQLPYIKNVKVSDLPSTELQARKFTEWVTERIDRIEANTKAAECYVAFQFEYFGGRHSRLAHNGDDGLTSFSWRDSSFLLVLDVFYNGKKPKVRAFAEQYQKETELEALGEGGKFSNQDRRLLWGSHDRNLHAARTYYYDQALTKYERLAANKARFDPMGVFTANKFSPNQQQDSRPFKVPKARAARSRQPGAAAASSAAGSVGADPSDHESDTASVAWSDTNTALSAAESRTAAVVAEDVVIYAKPEYSASQFNQLGGTQPTQLADFDALELDEGKVTFACMHGHGSTMGADLSLDKDVYLFGTSAECDVNINHSHWHRLPVPPERANEPWFKLYVQPSRSSPGDTKVYIEDISNGGVFLNGRPMAKGERKLLRWGDIITGGEPELELFRYSYRSIDNSPTEDIQGDKSIYRLEKITLGTGNYSQVVKAFDVRTKEVCACKVIDRLNREFNQQERDGIALEIDLLKDLNHKNILKFIDVSQEKYKTYIFTEFIEGVTLYGHYRDVNNYMSEVDTRHIFVQVCRAVEYLHKNNIVHRDIKSENIMITPTLHVKLIDFGLARHCVASRPVLSTHCGTPSYMAPEIALGEDSNGYGKPVDVWALGVVLFRMLTGSYPFHSDQCDNEHDRPLGIKVENVELGEAIDREKEVGLNKLDIEYSAGRQPYYKKNWRPHLDKKAPRSPEVLRLLERMLKTDPSQRVRIEHVLADDWFLMMDEHLEKFEASSGTTFAGLKSETGSVEDPASAAPWGELVLLPGCVPDAPRRILLSKDQTWFGRQSKDVDVHIGNSFMLSGVHCLIDRGANGEIMVTNASRNGTYINSLKIEIQRASQLLCGDELGFIMPPDDPNIVNTAFLPRTIYKRPLVYKVNIYGVPEATEDDRIRRRYADSTYQYEPRGRLLRKSPSTGEVWAILKPLTEVTQVQELTQAKYTFGRNEDCDIVIRNPFVSRTHCVLEWVPEDRQAYLKNLTLCGTYVNDGLTCQDRLQLRQGDKIYLRRNIAKSPEEVAVCVGYSIEFTDPQHVRKRQMLEKTPQVAQTTK
ncbi:unnamed protein product [Mortierella alpina]